MDKIGKSEYTLTSQYPKFNGEAKELANRLLGLAVDKLSKQLRTEGWHASSTGAQEGQPPSIRFLRFPQMNWTQVADEEFVSKSTLGRVGLVAEDSGLGRERGGCIVRHNDRDNH
jgi:hypothetical protein